MDSTAQDWVSETAFGKWFLSTDIWFKYVLAKAVMDLKQLAGQRVATPVSRLLDIGCGQGLAFSLLQKTFSPAQIIAVDIDPNLLVRAANAASECGCPVEIKRNSVTRLDLPEASVDMIFCHQLIHHVANQTGALRELYRVLAPGGMLLLGESCETFIKTWPVRWFFRHPPGAEKSAEGFLELIRTAGFEFGEADIHTSTPWWSLPDFGIARKLRLMPEPKYPTELVVVARKAVGRD